MVPRRFEPKSQKPGGDVVEYAQVHKARKLACLYDGTGKQCLRIRSLCGVDHQGTNPSPRWLWGEASRSNCHAFRIRGPHRSCDTTAIATWARLSADGSRENLRAYHKVHRRRE